ncbi:hypothetical protein G6F32_016812 [Rhizopus arrhizus]|nr:hypothetical protein G6F32_016812 [Rhizopus arrhizus]
MRDLPRHEVRHLVHGQHAVGGLQPQGTGRMRRDAGQRLFGRHPKERASHTQHQPQGQHGRGPGIQVGRDRNRHAVTAQQVQRRQLRFTQSVESARQQHGHRAGSGHRHHVAFREVFQVVR